MFTIYTQPTKAAKVATYLDGQQPTAVPAHILVGIGNKEQRYKEWLEKEFSHNNKLINFLAKLVDVGTEHGHLGLLTHSKLLSFQTKVVKQFLIEHEEAIQLMIPYLKQGMSMQKKNMDELTEEEKGLMNNGASMTLGQLPVSDRDQILALMQQAESADAPEAQTIEVSDTPTDTPAV